MTRRTALPFLLAICLAWSAVTVTRAAEDVLDVIPSEALGLVLINRLADTDAKIRQTSQQMQLPLPGPLTAFKARSRIKEGLDERGTLAVVMMPAEDPDSEPAVLVFLPVADFGKLIEPFEPDDPSARIVEVRSPDGPALVAKLGAYAVATAPKHRRSLENALAAKNEVAHDLAFLRPWSAASDVAGVLTTSGVKFVCAKAQEGLRAARAGMEAVGGKENPAVAGLKVYEKLFAIADEQVAAVAVGGRIDDQGAVRLTSRTRFVPSGQAAERDQAQPAPEGLLAGLPAGPFVFAFGGAWGEAASEAMLRFSGELIKAMPELYGLSDAQADKLMELSRESMKAIRGMSFMIGVGEPGEPLYSNMLFSMRMDNAQAYMSEYEKQIEAINEIFQQADSPFMGPMKVTKIDVSGTPGLKIVMGIPTPPGMEDVPNFAGMMEGFFGSGGKIKMFLAAADERTVVAAYTSKQSLRRCIRAARRPQASLASDPGVAATAALLPPNAPMVGYWSPQGTIEFANRAISLFAPAEQGGFKLPAFPQTPPVGLAVTIPPHEVQTHLVIPAEVLKAIGGYVAEVQKIKAEKDAL